MAIIAQTNKRGMFFSDTNVGDVVVAMTPRHNNGDGEDGEYPYVEDGDRDRDDSNHYPSQSNPIGRRLVMGDGSLDRSALRVGGGAVEMDHGTVSGTLGVQGRLTVGTSDIISSTPPAPLDVTGDRSILRGTGGRTEVRVVTNSVARSGRTSECVFTTVCGTDDSKSDPRRTTEFGSSPVHPLFVRNSGEKRVTMDPRGRVGIAVDSPQALLHVGGDAIFTGSCEVGEDALVSGSALIRDVEVASNGKSAALRIVHDVRDVIEKDMHVTDGDGDSNPLKRQRHHHALEVVTPAAVKHFAPSASALAVTGDRGFVGINTDAPSDHLHVGGRVRVDDRLEARSGMTVLGPSHDRSPSAIARFFPYRDDEMITTTSTSNIDLTEGREPILYVGYGCDTANDEMIVPSEMAVAVGVGTSSPVERLHVEGNLFLTGDVLQVSDAKLNDDMQAITSSAALNDVLRMNAYSYTRRDHARLTLGSVTDDIGNDDDGYERHAYVGFDARELKDVSSRLVAHDASKDVFCVRHSAVLATVVESVKHLHGIVIDLRQRVDRLHA